MFSLFSFSATISFCSAKISSIVKSLWDAFFFLHLFNLGVSLYGGGGLNAGFQSQLTSFTAGISAVPVSSAVAIISI